MPTPPVRICQDETALFDKGHGPHEASKPGSWKFLVANPKRRSEAGESDREGLQRTGSPMVAELHVLDMRHQAPGCRCANVGCITGYLNGNSAGPTIQGPVPSRHSHRVVVIAASTAASALHLREGGEKERKKPGLLGKIEQQAEGARRRLSAPLSNVAGVIWLATGTPTRCVPPRDTQYAKPLNIAWGLYSQQGGGAHESD